MERVNNISAKTVSCLSGQRSPSVEDLLSEEGTENPIEVAGRGNSSPSTASTEIYCKHSKTPRAGQFLYSSPQPASALEAKIDPNEAQI